MPALSTEIFFFCDFKASHNEFLLCSKCELVNPALTMPPTPNVKTAKVFGGSRSARPSSPSEKGKV
jgi:hypothetical protein